MDLFLTSFSNKLQAEETMSSSDDDQPFVKILKSMGIEDFDPLVPVALNEYAARFAAELLQDAKDYSVHAGRSEISAEDIKLAVKLSDTNTVSADARETVANRVREQLQKKSLTDLADQKSVLIRYPAEMFMQRSHTYIPGGEAYTEEDEGDEGDVMQVDGVAQAQAGSSAANSASSAAGGAVKFTPGARTTAKRLDQAAGFEMEE